MVVVVKRVQENEAIGRGGAKWEGGEMNGIYGAG